MSSLTLCMSSTATAFSSSRPNFSPLSYKVPSSISCLHLPSLSLSSLSHTINPLRYSHGSIVKPKTRNNNAGFRAFCYAPPLFTPRNLQLISTISSVVLILAKGTAIQKSFIVPLFALQAPAAVVAWIKGTYGVWAAFLALLVRLFFYIPGELELPFLALLLVIVTPYEVMKLRDTKEGAAISLLIAAYLAFQHFSRTSLQRSFDQGSIVATLAVTGITVASLLLLI